MSSRVPALTAVRFSTSAGRARAPVAKRAMTAEENFILNIEMKIGVVWIGLVLI